MHFVTCTQACQWKITDQISDLTGQQAVNKVRHVDGCQRFFNAVISMHTLRFLKA